ncbi:MAG: arginine deiminase-related protein [Tessaracoccus sp.]
MTTTNKAAFVRRPSPRLAEGLVTHIERSDDVDAELAVSQWDGYVQALRDAGYEIIEVEPAPDCPDGVFVEDTMVVVDGLAVITRIGAESRLPEHPGARRAAQDRGLTVVELTDAPVEGDLVLDGGDLLKIGRTVYVGVGGRTTEAGAAALRHHLATVGWDVVSVPIAKTLHLKSQVTALPDGTVIGYEPLVDDPSFWPAFLPVPEWGGSHVVVTGSNSVLMADDAPKTAALLRERGLDVVTVPIGEFEKLEGCVTCLSVRLHDAD